MAVPHGIDRSGAAGGVGAQGEQDFTQNGVGAVTRTVQDKLHEIWSVTDFGTVGNGATDDRNAISAAVTAANGRLLLFPGVTYRMDSALAFSNTDRLYFEQGAVFSGTLPTGGLREYEFASSNAIAASKMRIERLWENSSFPLEDEASIWSGKAETFFGVSKEFTSSSGLGDAPQTALFVFANNNDCSSAVVAFIADAIARTTNDEVFAANFITRSASGISTPKLVGLEIDIIPAAGVTPSTDSVGLVINAFNTTSTATAVLIGGFGSASWGFGIGTFGITGPHHYVNSGDTVTATSFIDARNGTYSQSAIRVGRGIAQSIQFGVSAFGTDGYIYIDTNDNMNIQTGSGGILAFKKADGTTEATFAASGIWDVVGHYRVDGTQVVSNRGAAVADASGGGTVDAEARTAINTLLARLRIHGLISA